MSYEMNRDVKSVDVVKTMEEGRVVPDLSRQRDVDK